MKDKHIQMVQLNHFMLSEEAATRGLQLYQKRDSGASVFL